MSEANKALFQRYMEMWTSGDITSLESVVAADFVGHSGADPDKDDDLVSLRVHMAQYHAAFPDVEVTLDAQIAEGELVATRMTARSSRGTVAGFNFSRYRGGKIVEEWAMWERP